jgi:hypothetical protein
MPQYSGAHIQNRYVSARSQSPSRSYYLHHNDYTPLFNYGAYSLYGNGTNVLINERVGNRNIGKVHSIKDFIAAR